MNLYEVVLCCIAMLLSTARQVICKNTYDIPVAFNPLIQDSVTIGSTAKLFYDMDKDFYSKVTVIDAANNAEQRVKDTIRKTINVVFLTVASSHVSRTLTDANLLYPTKSNWSYTVDVNSILAASKGELSTINDKTRIDKIQENAMKVLEVRFGFEKTEILNRLKLELQDYYAVDEAMWIGVVGIIVEKVISSRSALLNLTTCYLADMLNKKAEQIQGFTLNEVDTYIYNTAMLLEKVPQYRENVIARLYDTFQLTSTDLSRISNTDLSEINTMILHDVLQLFTSSVLNKLRVTANEITQKDSSFDSEMLLSCTNKWRPFLTIIIPESFDNSAEAMAIEVETLSALVNISYSEIQQYTITEMITLLEMIIDPLSAQKTLVEATTLSRVLQRHSSDKLDTKKDNVFQVIYRFTNFTERQLTTLYGWTSEDYIFSSMFTLEEANDVCSLNLMDYDLLALAKLTVGQIGDMICQSFNVLREIWERKTIKFLEDEFSSEKLALDIPISLMVSQLTKAPSTINYRVLNISSEAEELISDLSINNITMVTTYRSSYLKTLSFQDVIGIVLHLKHNGSFDHQVVSHFILTSLTPSLTITSKHIHTTIDYQATLFMHKSHTTTSVLNTSPYLNNNKTRIFSSNTFLPFSSNLLKLASSFIMPQNTTMQISNTTISSQRTVTGNATHQFLTGSISISQSKMQHTITPNNVRSLTTYKYELDKSNMLNYSISPTKQIGSTNHISSTTTSHPFSYSISIDSNSYIKTENLSFARSTASRFTTPHSFSISLHRSSYIKTENLLFATSRIKVLSLSANYSSNNINKLTYSISTKTRKHSIEHTFTTFSHATTSLSKEANISKTPNSTEYYKTTTFSTRTVHRMTKQAIPVSRNIGNTTVAFTSTTLQPSIVINSSYLLTSKYLAESELIIFTKRLHLSYNPSINVSLTTSSAPTSVYQSKQSKMSLLPTVESQSLNITSTVTKLLHLITSFINTDYINTSLNTINVPTENISSRKTESQVITSKPNFSKTKTSMTFSITPHNTRSYTTSTTVMVNTTISSPVMADIDASSRGDFQSKANHSSPNMISLIIQTTRTENTMLTNVKASTPIITSLLSTTKITIPKQMTSPNTPSTKPEILSIVEASSTMKVFTATTEILTQEPPTEKPSTPTSTIRAVVKPSSNRNLVTLSMIGKHSKTSSSYFSTTILPTPPILSQSTTVSNSSLPTRLTPFVAPSTTKSEATSSSIQKPGRVRLVRHKTRCSLQHYQKLQTRLSSLFE